MSVKKHPDYIEEKERLEYTKEYIEEVLTATTDYRDKYKSNIKEAMKELDYLDSSQSYINIILNSKFMETAEKNFEALYKVKDKPYFARVDFQREENNKKEKLYIGKTSLYRAEDDIPLIVDWRSPVANIYYEGRLGPITYETTDGTQKGDILLKRQFTIEQGELKGILDVDVTTNDSFLQSSLDANVDNRLKDIASTIQREQNKVIRAPINKPLIVQGVAGSGKTTIALHRIAYFIYTYEKTFSPENFMIIAPNNLFLNYISDVLPELGVEDVVQTTFVDFMRDLVGKKYKLVNKNKYIIDSVEDNVENSLYRWLILFKGTLDFRNIIDNYIKEFETNFIPNEDILLGDITLLTYSEINDMFLVDLSYLPFFKRLSKIKTRISRKLKEVKKDILESTMNYYDSNIEDIRYLEEDTEERRLKIVSLINERDDKIKSIKKQSSTLVKDYMNNFDKKKIIEYYNHIVCNKDNLREYSKDILTEEQIDFMYNHSKNILYDNKLELEDYSPLAYMKHKILGFTKKLKMNNVLIDEAQDFNIFEFYILKEILNTNMFTLLGDISQGIHSYRSINDWDEVMEGVFSKEETSYMSLVQSYRTTIEIMDYANKIISKIDNDKIDLAKPVIRHGNPPERVSFKSKELLIDKLHDKIQSVKEKNYKTIAVICKSLEECNKIKKQMNKDIEINILTDKDTSYKGGVVLVPSYLAKGLEFDCIFIVSIDEDYLDKDLDIKLLYVAMTRALHEAYIYHLEGNLTLLDEI
ncbi:AAA family ATPase [Clostridium sp. D2Q-11]|uniref:DNA 3'-5' helicase n=1 Tax=Anaeromonas frigoriresistens TaxID=2683708 RepID=A0A942UZ67_9FIRM|nr:RNA polymerase recycling motor HelD [Anaeromonas frigoriresistens]MBS4538996.1 AAA family ATPase [Anaeromonas frigoriresistens]